MLFGVYLIKNHVQVAFM